MVLGMSTTEQSTRPPRDGQGVTLQSGGCRGACPSKEAGLDYVDLDRYPLNAAATSLLPQQASAVTMHSQSAGSTARRS